MKERFKNGLVIAENELDCIQKAFRNQHSFFSFFLNKINKNRRK